jgi:hypothetical protein
MANSIDIVNSALTKLGAARITALTDNVKEAREMNAIYELRRDARLRAHNWNFAMERDSLPALSDAPAWGYTLAYQIPSDCLRVVQVNDIWVIPGLSDYMTGPDAEPFSIEGRKIVTDWSAPLKIRYIKRVEDASQFDALFCEVLACDLAFNACEALTQSNTKKEAAKADLRTAIIEAVRANAIELPPSHLPDDSWIMSRI